MFSKHKHKNAVKRSINFSGESISQPRQDSTMAAHQKAGRNKHSQGPWSTHEFGIIGLDRSCEMLSINGLTYLLANCYIIILKKIGKHRKKDIFDEDKYVVNKLFL